MFDYRWFKVGADIFNDPKIKIIEADENADTIICIFFKSLCLARIVNDSGYLYINEDTPYTLKTLAIEFNRPVDKVKAAIKVLKKLQMIEFTEDKFYRVKNWTKYQNIDAIEKQRAETSKRVAKHRAKKKLANENPNCNNGDNNADEVKENGEEPNIHDDEGKEANKNEEIKDVINSGVSNENKEDIQINNDNTQKESIDINNAESKSNSGNPTSNDDETKEDAKCNENSSQCNIDKNEGNVIQENICNDNVTDNNVTVTPKRKRETESQTKTEKQKESERDNELSFKLSEICAKLTKHYDSITGKVGCLDYGKLRLALSIHGEEYVKMAIDKAIESGKSDFNYINGILKNWKREGYPNEKEEVKVNGGKRNSKGNTADKNEFAGFKAKKPKQLTEEQRKKIEADLI